MVTWSNTPPGNLGDRLHDRGCVELVRQLFENAAARLGHREEALEGQRLEPGEVGARGQNASDGRPVPAEGDALDPALPRAEHAGRFGGRLLDELALLSLAAPAEAIGRRPAGTMATLDEAGARLRGNEALTLEDADGIAAQPNEHCSDGVVLGKRFDERPHRH